MKVLNNKTILLLFLILTLVLSSFCVSSALTSSQQIYYSAFTTVSYTPAYDTEIQDVYIYTKSGVCVFFSTGQRSGWAINKIDKDYIWFKNSSHWGGSVKQEQWCTPNGNYKTLTTADFPLIVCLSPTFPGYNANYTGVWLDATGTNINDRTPISSLPLGISITSPSNHANILDEFINLKFVCKVPISSGGSTNALKAEILGQRIECYSTTNQSGSVKYYLPRHDGMKPHFIESNIIDMTSNYYVVQGVISVPNFEPSVTSTIHVKLPTKSESNAGIITSTWQTYDASIKTYFDTTVEPDIGGSSGDTGNPNQPIEGAPDRSDYEDTIIGGIQYGVDTLIWLISLPFQVIATIFQTLGNFLNQVSAWIGTSNTGVIGFFTSIFGFFPAPVTALIGGVITLIILISIFKFIKR